MKRRPEFHGSCFPGVDRKMMNEVGRVSRIMYLDFINDSLLLGCVDEPQFGGSRCFLQR